MSNRRKPKTQSEERPEGGLALPEKVEITEKEATEASAALGCDKLTPAVIKSMAILGFQFDGAGAHRTLQGRVIVSHQKLDDFLQILFTRLNNTDVPIQDLIEGGKVVAQLSKAQNERFRVSLEIMNSSRGTSLAPPMLPTTVKKSFGSGAIGVMAQNVQIVTGAEEKPVAKTPPTH